MSRAAQLATGLVAGAAAWTFTEYATHRWVLHGPFGKSGAANRPATGSTAKRVLARIPVGGIHQSHHRDPNWSVLWGRAGGHVAMAATGAAGSRALLAAAPSLPAAAVIAAGVAWSAGYSTYDIVHHRLHHRAPTTALGVRMRQRHFRHHFAGARTNLGVTTAVWDRLLGTEAPSRPVRIPSATAPPWLDRLGGDFSSASSAQPPLVQPA